MSISTPTDVIVNETCSICVENKHLIQIGPCKHAFCHTCTTNWLAVKRTCPVCRARVEYKRGSREQGQVHRGNMFSGDKDLFILSRFIGI